MLLSEEQLIDRTEFALAFLEAATEGLPRLEEASEEAQYLTAIIIEHIIETYHEPTLAESILSAAGGADPNDELFEELLDLLIDESVGSAVATAVYGIRSAVNKIRQKHAETRKADADLKHKVVSTMASSASQKAKEANKTAKKAPGIKANAAASYHNAKSKKLNVRAKAAASNRMDKSINAQIAQKRTADTEKKRANLQTKIDTGISNVKNKAKNAIHNTINKVSGFAGKLAGAV